LASLAEFDKKIAARADASAGGIAAGVLYTPFLIVHGIPSDGEHWINRNRQTHKE
jgi:hypothetical protein